MRSRVCGFSIIELVVVLAVLGILASVALPLTEVVQTRKKEDQLQRALWELRDSIDAYKRAVDDGRIIPRPTTSGYPPSLNALVEGATVSGARGGSERIYFLRRIPADPLYPDPSVPAKAHWDLRSYASTADRPEAGDDVYDVLSKSSKTGLNGIPYRDW